MEGTVDCTIDPNGECDIQKKNTYLRQEPRPYMWPPSYDSYLSISAILILRPTVNLVAVQSFRGKSSRNLRFVKAVQSFSLAAKLPSA
jgi:hypothetical protein